MKWSTKLKKKNWLQYEVYKRRIFSPRASLWFWNLGASCCNLPVEVAEGVEPFCERRSTLLWICRLFPASEDITLPNILESCSLSWGHATSLYVMSTSLQIKQIFFADLPDSKFSYGLTLIWYSLTHWSTISLPLFLPRNEMVWIKKFTSLAFGQEQHILDCHSPSLHIRGPLHPSSKPGHYCAFAFGER